MKGYFLYLLKKRIPILITFTVICIAVFIATANTQKYQSVYHTYYSGYQDYYPNNLILIIYSVVIVCLAVITPVIEFSFKMRKISSDQAYSFPIKRRRLYLTRYLIGLIEIVVPFTFAYLISISIIFWSPNMYVFQWFFIYLLAALAFGILLYSYIVFFYTQANNILDGIITIILVNLCPFAIAGMVYYYSMEYPSSEIIFYALPYSPLFLITDFFQDLLCNHVDKVPNGLLAFSISYIVLFVVALGYFIFASQYFKGESAGQKSTSWACYKLLLPFTLIAGVTMFGYDVTSFAFVAMMLIVTYLGYAIYLRSFKLSTKYWILCGIIWTSQIVAFAVELSIHLF